MNRQTTLFVDLERHSASLEEHLKKAKNKIEDGQKVFAREIAISNREKLH